MSVSLESATQGLQQAFVCYPIQGTTAAGMGGQRAFSSLKHMCIYYMKHVVLNLGATCKYFHLCPHAVTETLCKTASVAF